MSHRLKSMKLIVYCIFAYFAARQFGHWMSRSLLFHRKLLKKKKNSKRDRQKVEITKWNILWENDVYRHRWHKSISNWRKRTKWKRKEHLNVKHLIAHSHWINIEHTGDCVGRTKFYFSFIYNEHFILYNWKVAQQQLQQNMSVHLAIVFNFPLIVK